MEDDLWIPEQVWLLATLHVARGFCLELNKSKHLKQLGQCWYIRGVQWMLIYFSFLSLKFFSVKYTLKIYYFKHFKVYCSVALSTFMLMYNLYYFQNLLSFPNLISIHIEH